MNLTTITDDWNQLRRRLTEKWLWLTSEKLPAIAGSRRQLVALPQRHYGSENNRRRWNSAFHLWTDALGVVPSQRLICCR